MSGGLGVDVLGVRMTKLSSPRVKFPHSSHFFSGTNRVAARSPKKEELRPWARPFVSHCEPTTGRGDQTNTESTVPEVYSHLSSFTVRRSSGSVYLGLRVRPECGRSRRCTRLETGVCPDGSGDRQGEVPVRFPSIKNHIFQSTLGLHYFEGP